MKCFHFTLPHSLLHTNIFSQIIYYN